MVGLFKSVTNFAADVTTLVVAPVAVAVDLAGAVVKPVAEVAQDLASEVKSLKDR
ncbi:hypothetical protein [Massilia timonae]|uniref:Uncharacterized protein n=1 Tax=Massilia timonae TaxID=47229 RepID=A0A1S2N7M8_9BURK|nr:hypothetical protein [Massilia timonae]OIJ41096.1 hypothetical protein LO55_5033 [Massilia timonae]